MVTVLGDMNRKVFLPDEHSPKLSQLCFLGPEEMQLLF